jgi:tRNA threonylcarbamoyladenosine biosynthesis protein TsaB
MIVLALATSADPCGIAISDDRGLLVERTFRHRMQLSERLLGDCDELLRDAGIEIAEVDAFVADIGPGSFTGVRIGVTTIKTWSDLLGKPAVGVSALEAQAFPFVGGHADRLVSIIRARPGAVYVAQYDGRAGDELSAPAMLTAAEVEVLISEWKGLTVTICGDAASLLREEMEVAVNKVGVRIAFAAAGPPRAGVFAEIGRTRNDAGHFVPAMELEPLYIAPPPIGQKHAAAR